MQASCYILYSENLKRFYIGATDVDLHHRVEKHLSSFYGTDHFTSKAKDWIVFLNIQTDNFHHAMRLERKIKSMKSTKYILNLKKYPELVQKIMDETRASDS